MFPDTALFRRARHYFAHAILVLDFSPMLLRIARFAGDGQRLIEVHRRLLEKSRSSKYAGILRADQNWIGGSSYNPLSAAFVPPPPEHVEQLLADLCEFCNGDSLPPVAQAGIAHAQFETIIRSPMGTVGLGEP